jgi:FkbM family methyltransferase
MRILEQPYTLFHGECHKNKRCVDQELREYFPDYSYKGVFFDVGAFEPITISNSHHFYMNGWRCYCFEAIPGNAQKLRKQRNPNFVFNFAISDHDLDEVEFNEVYLNDEWTASFSAITISEEYKSLCGWNDNNRVKKIRIPQRTLNTIINTYIHDLERIDILSVDVEGGELACLKGLDIPKYKPRVIVIENLTRSSVFTDYLAQYDYKLHKINHINYFYVANDFEFKA